MASTWNNDTQFGPSPVIVGAFFEGGTFTATSSDVSGATINVPTKMSKITGGFGITSDGLPAVPTLGATSNGVAVFTRGGPINDTTPVLFYLLAGQ
jgi:hypothetical protein